MLEVESWVMGVELLVPKGGASVNIFCQPQRVISLIGGIWVKSPTWTFTITSLQTGVNKDRIPDFLRKSVRLTII